MSWHLCVEYLQTGCAIWTEYKTKDEASKAHAAAVKKYAHTKQVRASLHRIQEYT